MLKLISSGVFLLLALIVTAQSEKVFIDLSRYTALAGDTIAVKGTITLSGYPSPISTNLYVQVYSSSGRLLTQDVFPAFHGHSFGQIFLNDSLSTDNYYIVAYTKQQLNYQKSNRLFNVPILVYNVNKPQTIFHKKIKPPINEVVSGNIKGITWTTTITKGMLSTQLESDSGINNIRKLHIAKHAQGDTSLMADIILNENIHHKTILLPIDSTREGEMLFFYEDNTLLGRQFIRLKILKPTVEVNPDTLDISPNGYNSWKINIEDSMSYFTSIIISDANKTAPSPITIDQLRNSYTEDLTIQTAIADTSFLSYTGHIINENGKTIKNAVSGILFVTGIKDASYLFNKIVPIDKDGNFTIDSVFFFDNANLQFQITHAENGSAKNITLHSKEAPPLLIDNSLFNSIWEDDKNDNHKEDAWYTSKITSDSENHKAEILKSVTVKTTKNSRKELDNLYTTGSFSEPSLYAYDLRTDSLLHVQDIGTLLENKINRLRYDKLCDCMKDNAGDILHYFVNEQEVDFRTFKTLNLMQIAYIKALESDLALSVKTNFAGRNGPSHFVVSAAPTASNMLSFNILIYTKKRKDAQNAGNPKGVINIPVKGYTSIINFTGDKAVLYWSPWNIGNRLRLQFYNKEGAKKFRIRISGINNTGKIVDFESIIE